MEISKTVMYEFWYDYVKSKYGGETKLCYMDTDSFIGYMIYKKNKNIYVDIANDVETRFDTSNYESDRPLPNEKKIYRINGS